MHFTSCRDALLPPHTNSNEETMRVFISQRRVSSHKAVFYEGSGECNEQRSHPSQVPQSLLPWPPPWQPSPGWAELLSYPRSTPSTHHTSPLFSPLPTTHKIPPISPCRVILPHLYSEGFPLDNSVRNRGRVGSTALPL